MVKKLFFGFLIIILLVLSLGLVIVSPVQATTINPHGSLPAGQTVDDDLLIAGQTVQIDGTVNGIVIAAGSSVTVTGTINGDLIAAAQTVVLSDTAVVTGNVFAGGQDITVDGKIEGSLFVGSSATTLAASASVGRNLYFGGYSLTTQPGSVIGIDLRAGAYQTILNGDIKQDAVINAPAIELNGKIGHDADLWLDTTSGNSNQYMPGSFPTAVAPGLRVGSSAQIIGKLTYTSKQQYDITVVPGGGIFHQAPVVEASKTTFGPKLVTQETGNVFQVWHALSSLITLLLAGALIVGLFGKSFAKTVAVAQKRTLASGGVGLLAIVLAIPVFLFIAVVTVLVAILFTFVSLGGLTYPILGLGLGTLGLAATAFIVLVSVVSKLIVSYWLGDLILRSFKVNLVGGWQKALPLILGVVIYVIVSSLPFIGWLFGLIATIIGVGAVWFWLFPGNLQPICPPHSLRPIRL